MTYFIEPNTKALNVVLQQILEYCIEYGCTISTALQDYDVPLSPNTELMIEEAAEYVLNLMSTLSFEERL